MKTIVNKTRRPLKIKLAQGRVLRLGLAKEGQIATHDAERESVQKMIEAGAEANVKEAGLDAITDIRLGDALQTLRDVPEPLELVLIDGWKDLYLPVLGLLKPRLRPGAVVLADNIFLFKKALRPCVEHMQSGEHGFESTTLPFWSGFEYSVYLGDGPGGRI